MNNRNASLSRATRRMAAALLAGVALLTPVFAPAQTYPDKSRIVRIVVPSGPGSALDSLARSYERAMAGVTDLKFIVENKPGADGVIGVQSVLTAPGDGYTMLLASSSMMALNPVMIPDLVYDPLKDLQPLASISQAGLVMSLGSGTTFRRLSEFVAAARAAPGKYTCATSSATLTMSCEFLQASAGVKLLVVPYRTTAAALVALASGEADAIFLDAGSAIAQWNSGKVRGVVSTTAKRQAALPDLPTTQEEGLPDFRVSAWYAFYFKAGAPSEAAAAMRDLLRKAAQRPEVRNALRMFVHEQTDLTVEELVALNRSEIENWRTLIRNHNIDITRK